MKRTIAAYKALCRRNELDEFPQYAKQCIDQHTVAKFDEMLSSGFPTDPSEILDTLIDKILNEQAAPNFADYRVNDKRGAMVVDSQIRARMLVSLQKAGDTSTLEVARRELTELVDNLETKHEAQSFTTILSQTTSLEPLLMRKTTFLLIDYFFDKSADLAALSFGELLTYMCKRMSDEEITEETYQDEISKTFRAFELLACKCDKRDLLFAQIEFEIRKESIQTQIIALNSLNEMVRADPLFPYAFEAGKLCINIARGLHDGVRERLEFCALRCINEMMDLGFDDDSLLQIASKSIELRYFRSRETAYLIMEKLVLLDRLNDKIEVAKQLFVRIQEKKYDEVASVRIEAFRACETFKEFIAQYEPEWVEKVSSRSASRAGSRNGTERANFRDFRDRIAISRRSPGTHTLGNVEDPDEDEYDFTKNSDELTKNIVPIKEHIYTDEELLEDVKRCGESAGDSSLLESSTTCKTKSPADELTSEASDSREENSMSPISSSPIIDSTSKQFTNAVESESSVSHMVATSDKHNASMSLASSKEATIPHRDLSRSVSNSHEESTETTNSVAVVSQNMDIDMFSKETPSIKNETTLVSECEDVHYFGDLPISLIESKSDREQECSTAMYKVPEYTRCCETMASRHMTLSGSECCGFEICSSKEEISKESSNPIGETRANTCQSNIEEFRPSSAKSLVRSHGQQNCDAAPEELDFRESIERRASTGSLQEAVYAAPTSRLLGREECLDLTSARPAPSINSGKCGISVVETSGFSFASNSSAVAFAEAQLGNLNCAYATMLLQNEEFPKWRLREDILRLMGRTGACVSSLDDDVVDTMASVIADLLEEGFLDQVIPWINEIMHRRGVFGPETASRILSGLAQVWEGHPRWNDIQQLKRFICTCYPEFEADYR